MPILVPENRGVIGHLRDRGDLGLRGPLDLRFPHGVKALTTLLVGCRRSTARALHLLRPARKDAGGPRYGESTRKENGNSFASVSDEAPAAF